MRPRRCIKQNTSITTMRNGKTREHETAAILNASNKRSKPNKRQRINDGAMATAKSKVRKRRKKRAGNRRQQPVNTIESTGASDSECAYRRGAPRRFQPSVAALAPPFARKCQTISATQQERNRTREFDRTKLRKQAAREENNSEHRVELQRSTQKNCHRWNESKRSENRDKCNSSTASRDPNTD